MNDDDILAARVIFDRDVPSETLAEWTAQTAAPKPQSEVRLTGALLVRAGDEWFGLPASMVDSALPVGPIHSVPYLSSRAFLGLANVDGELAPCISLAALAGIEPDPWPGKPRIISVRVEEGRFSLLVDEAAGTSGYDPTLSSSPPDTSLGTVHHFVRSMVQLEDKIVGIADEKLLGAALLRSLKP